MKWIVVAFLFSFASIQTRAQSETILFEGYSKVISSTEHIGYIVARYSFDTKSKEFRVITFMKINSNGTTATETTRAVAKDNFAPVSYDYNFVSGKTTKSIQGRFRGNQFSAAILENGKKKTVETKLKEGTFLSSFLVYMMLKSKTGIQTGVPFKYKAIAEEDAKVYEDGDAKVGAIEKRNGFNVFKIANTFKGSTFDSYVTDRGEVFLLESLSQGLKVELVAKPNDATADFGLTVPILKELFGEVPVGTKNTLSQSIKPVELRSTDILGAPPGPIDKGANVPAGQGIHLKKESQPASAPAQSPPPKEGQ